MKKALIIGPNFHYFNQSIERALVSMGWLTHVEAYDNPIHPYSLPNKIRYKFGDKVFLKQLSRERYDKHIRYVADSWKPELTIILNGDNLLPDTLRHISQYSKIAIWLYDSIKKYPLTAENIKYADALFCYEQDDIQYIKEKYGTDAYFLPQAVDTELYFPIPNINKTYDISFAGEIWSSKKRERLLNEVIKSFPDKKIRIIGRRFLFEKSPWKYLTRSNRDIYSNKNATAEELNTLYNSSRVVINIHNEQQTNGANPKVYEILSSGAIEVCDSNTYIEKNITATNLLLYGNTHELIEKIKYALENQIYEYPTSFIAENTFIVRVKQIIKTIKQI